jgi:hypothetical protein
MAIAQRQQGRLCFAFLFEEDEEKAQEKRQRGKVNAPLLNAAFIEFHQHTLTKNSPFCFASSLLRGAGTLRAQGVPCFVFEVASPSGGAKIGPLRKFGLLPT